MTQISAKLLDYLNTKPKDTVFTPTSVFLESGIDFGGQNIITHAFEELERDGLIERGKTYLSEASYYLL